MSGGIVIRKLWMRAPFWMQWRPQGRSRFAGVGEILGHGLAVIIERPSLDKVVLIRDGDGQGGHVAFAGRLGAGEAEEREVELAIGGGDAAVCMVG